MHATQYMRTGGAIAIYFIAAAGCIALTRFGAQVAPVWLATPVLVCALLSTPLRTWPLLLGLAALAHAAANALNQERLAFAAPYLVANISEAALAAFLLKRADVNVAFKSRTDVFRFLAICGVATPAISSAIMRIGLTLNSQTIAYGDVITWFLSIALGLLVFLPLLTALNSHNRMRLTAPGIRLKAVLLLAALAAICLIGMALPQTAFIVFLVIPILVLIAFDLGVPGAQAGLALTAILLLSGAVLGYGPQLGADDPREAIIRLQLLMLILSACVMPLAAIVEEKARLYESASHALEEAQQAWGEVIAAEANYRLLADNTRALFLRVNEQGLVLATSATSPVSDYDFGAIEGASLWSYLDPDGETAWRAALARAMTQREDEPSPARLRMRSRDGSWRIFDAIIRRTENSALVHDLIIILTPAD